MKRRVNLNEELIKSLDTVFGTTWARLTVLVGIPRSTLYRLKDKPAGIDMQQLLAIANGLRIPVGNFFYTGGMHMVKTREDYVASPYLPCRYEFETLRNVVENRRDITWVRASDIIGITTDNLKNSLLSEEAPVNRFLDFCEGFGIDPFTVLIDPNPKQRPRRSTASPTLLAEVAAMREGFAGLTGKYQDLAAKYGDLLEKYTTLLEAHRVLLHRFDEHVDGRRMDMAAEDIPETA